MPGFEFKPWEDVEADLRARGHDEKTIARVRTGYDEARLQQRSGRLRGSIEAGPTPATAPAAAPAAPAPPAAPPEAPGLVRRVAGRAYEDVAKGLRGVEETTAPLGRAVSRGYRGAAGKALAEALARGPTVGLAKLPGMPKSTAKTLAGVPGSMAEFAGKRPLETAGFAAADVLSGGAAAAEPAAAETVSLASRYALPLAKRVAKTAFAGLLAEPAERQLKTAAGEQPQASPEELTDIAVGGAKGYGLGELTYGTALRALDAAGRGIFGGRRRGPSVDALEAKPAIGTGGGSTPAEETPPTHLQQEPAAHTTRAVNEPAPIGRGAGSTPPAEPPLTGDAGDAGHGEAAPPTASGASPATSSQPPGQASGRHPTTTPAPAARADASRPASPAPAPRAEPPARPGPVGTFVAERQIRETAARQERARQAFAAASQPPRLALPPPMEPEPLPPPPMSVAAMNEAARVRAARRAARRGEFEMVPPDDPRVLAARAALRGEPAEPGQDTPTAQQQTARSAAQEALRAVTGESEATSAQAPRRRRPPGPKAASPVAGAERGEEVPVRVAAAEIPPAEPEKAPGEPEKRESGPLRQSARATEVPPPPTGPRTIRDPSSDPIVEGFRQRLLKAREQVARYKTGTMRWNRALQDKLRLQKSLRAAEKNAGLDPMDVLVPDEPKKFRQGKSTTLGSGFGALGDLGTKLTDLSGLKKTWTRFKRKFPMEREVAKQRPNSPVITETKRFEAEYTDAVQDHVDLPWFKTVQSIDPELLKDAEAEATRYYHAHGDTPEAEAAAWRAFPPAVQHWHNLNEAIFDQANAVRTQKFGLEPVQRWQGPFLPREEIGGRASVTLGGEFGGGGRGTIRTGMGGHAQSRVYETYRDGEAAGMDYDDPRNPMLTHLADNLQIIKTGEYFDRLEATGGLFHDRAAALKASPTGRPFKIKNAPGGEWWAATEADARFLDQNLSREPRGPWTSLNGYISEVFRNPNLMLGIPHLTRNMLSHLTMADPRAALMLPRDVPEWLRGSNPRLLREFEDAMPFSKSSRSAAEIIGAELHRGPVKDAISSVTHAVGTLSYPSRVLNFRFGDPAMRYALFKRYRQIGMGKYEAANHAWSDMVNYGTRSQMISTWRSWPGNFFVPWRWGSFANLLHHARYHPIRTAVVIGAIDYLREVNRRKTGGWFPLFWDSVETPIAQLAQSKDGVDFLKKATSIAALSYLFGPAGGLAAGNIDNLLKLVQGDPDGRDKNRLQHMFWGISQLYSNLPELYRKGDYSGMLRAALLGEHDALQYPPRQLWAQYVPESAPGMEKAPKVEAAETVQAGKDEQAKEREIARPALTARKDALKNIEQAYITGEANNDPERLEKAIEAAADADEPITSDDIRRLLGSPTVQRARAQAELETAQDPETRRRLQAEIRDWTTDIGDRAVTHVPKGARAAVAALRAKAALDTAQGAP